MEKHTGHSSDSTFSALEATKDGFLLTWRERRYLLRLAALPVVAHFVTTLAVIKIDPHMPFHQQFLFKIPAFVALAWFLFAMTRRIVLGEDAAAPPQDAGVAEQRRQALKLTIITYLFFNMVLGVGYTVMQHVARAAEAFQTATLYLALAAVMLMVLWSLRLVTLYVAASVGYPLRRLLRIIRGFGFSLRLVFLFAACGLPVLMVFLALAGILIPMEPDMRLSDLSLPQLLLTSLMGTLSTVMMLTVLNGALVSALREILGRKGGLAA